MLSQPSTCGMGQHLTGGVCRFFHPSLHHLSVHPSARPCIIGQPAAKQSLNQKPVRRVWTHFKDHIWFDTQPKMLQLDFYPQHNTGLPWEPLTSDLQNSNLQLVHWLVAFVMFAKQTRSTSDTGVWRWSSVFRCFFTRSQICLSLSFVFGFSGTGREGSGH